MTDYGERAGSYFSPGDPPQIDIEGMLADASAFMLLSGSWTRQAAIQFFADVFDKVSQTTPNRLDS
jgi:hypothetical protein